MSDRPVPRYVSVGKLEPEGAYCLTLDKHNLIIMQHPSLDIVQHLADLMNADFRRAVVDRQCQEETP